jgi:hypothetical protein
VEPVDIDTPRPAPEAVAKLTVNAANLEVGFDLTFTSVENDLSPAHLALARLSDGTLVGFSELEYDNEVGVDVVQYGDAAPRDVVTVLLYDTGMSHDDVRWIASGPGGDNRMWARTFGEAYLYFLMHSPRDWSDEEVLDAIQSTVVGDDTVMRFGGAELWVRRRGVWDTEKPTYSLPDDPPSTIIDAGVWLMLANRSAQAAMQLLNEYRGEPMDDDLLLEIEENLLRAAAAIGETLKFLPPGVEVIPVKACWSAGGLPIYRQAPEMFRRATLEIAAAEYRQAVVNFRDSYGPERG